MAYEMKYVPKINPKALVTGYIGKNTSAQGQYHGYLALSKGSK